MRRTRRFARVVALFLTATLVASACGDDGGSEGSATTAAPSTTEAKPVKGGTITIGQFSEPLGIDPAVLGGGGTVGGNEMAAIYDTLMRYDPDTQKYEPHTAESFIPNADFSVWTLKLKPNIKFADGTAYDAAAVKFAVDRSSKEGSSGPRQILNTFFESVTVKDPLTAEFKLKLGWPGFPYLFTTANGMIYSPTQFAKVGDPKVFNVTPGPAGAGPFIVKSYKPKEALELERNPNYWGGEVLLDSMKFVFINTPQGILEAMKSGTLQGGFVRDPETVDKARKDGYTVLNYPAPGGNTIVMNSGVVVTCQGGNPAVHCAGKPDGEKVTPKTPTSDVRVRRAVAYAVDPKVINDRIYAGKAKPDTAPFANSPFDPKVPGPKTDLNEAKRLVAEVKAGGWDGKIRLLSPNDPVATEWNGVVKSMLEAAGMTVESQTKATNDMVAQVLSLRDYDLSSFSASLLEDPDYNYVQLRTQFNTTNPRYGFVNKDMETAVEGLRTADTKEKQLAAYKRIAEIWTDQVPSHVITAIDQALLLNARIKGTLKGGQGITHFHKAWLAAS
jgi:peptide/nickel transport system substrate-binding protein